MRRVFSRLVLLLLLVGTLILTANVQPVRASGTVYIRADGSVDPITSAISTSDNITYTFTTSIAESIVVERDNIVLDGAGFTVQGDGSENGIDLSNRNNITIKNTNIENFYCGAYLDNSSNNTIGGNNITNNTVNIGLYSSSGNMISGNKIAANGNGEGVWLDSSSSNIISGNNITANVDKGIYLDSSLSNIISGNNIANNGGGICLGYSSNYTSISGNTFTNDGLYVWGSYQNSVENNTVNGRPLVYLEGVSNYTVDDARQVILVKCENIRVEGLNISRTDFGIELSETSNSTISGNNITSNVFGIYLASSSNYNSISGNNITNNGWGIISDSSASNSIFGNNITDNGFGILLASSSSNSIFENNITDNGYGIDLTFSSNNDIHRNNMTANSYRGIYLYMSSNNKFYHNNFINNSFQIYSEDSANIWDDGYPSGGNYWSDFNGTDLYCGLGQNETGSDGIGDTPYIIDGSNVDHYPSVNPLVIPPTTLAGDVNGDGKVSLADLTLLALAYNSKLGDPNWNSMADFAAPYGIIGLTDVVTLAMHYGQYNP